MQPNQRIVSDRTTRSGTSSQDGSTRVSYVRRDRTDGTLQATRLVPRQSPCKTEGSRLTEIPLLLRTGGSAWAGLSGGGSVRNTGVTERAEAGDDGGFVGDSTGVGGGSGK